MRRFSRLYAHFLVAALALAVAGLGLTACVAPGATMRHAMSADAFAGSQRNMHGRMAKLVGAWQVETTVVNQGTTFPALLTFTSDGIVLADEPPSPFETTGHGAWAATGPDSADFTFVALIGSEEGPLSATIKVVGSLQYDALADTWNGPFKVRVVDASGAELLADDGTFDATRIKAESLDVAAAAPEAGGTVPAPTAAAGLQQPEDVFDAFTAAVNAHDVDTALGFFADDAIVELPDEPPPNVFTGAAEIRSWLERIAQDNIHVEIEDLMASGDTVTATAYVDVDSLPPDLVLRGTVEATVQDGEITSFSNTLDEETLQKLEALQSQ
jgi:hypothetical protein